MSLSIYMHKVSGDTLVPANDELVYLPVVAPPPLDGVHTPAGARKLLCPQPFPGKHDNPGSPV